MSHMVFTEEVLERLGLIATDSAPILKPTLSEPDQVMPDPAMRPVWVLRDAGGDYNQPNSTETLSENTERISAELYGGLIGQGQKNKFYRQARKLVDYLVWYLSTHPDLAFENMRGDPALEALPPLRHVRWTLFSRGATTLYEIAQEGEPQKFWGSKLDIQVVTRVSKNPRLYPQFGDELEF